jgi:hypothetical protein
MLARAKGDPEAGKPKGKGKPKAEKKEPEKAAEPEPGKAYNMPVAQLAVDPGRFQYKLNTNRDGVTDEFRDVKQFNPDFAGVISVWKDPADGKTYVVKTHRPSAIIEAVRASDQADILKRITSTGEIPDGVEQGQDGSPYVSVKQTPEQTQAVVQAWRSGAIVGILAIGGPR